MDSLQNEVRCPSDSHLSTSVIMMPRDTNPRGTIFGGVILSGFLSLTAC